MRQDKQKAISLRKQGKTYREIQDLLIVSRGTLCDWFKDLDWSKHIRESNTKKHIKRSTSHLLKMNKARQIMLDKKYEEVEKEAEKEFKVYKKDPLFMAGLMLYAGEGDKSSRNLIRMSNSEFYLHNIFIKFAEKFLKTKRIDIKFWILLYPDHIIEECIAIWSKNLNISKNNFNKTQVIQGKSHKRKLQYGVGNSIISSTSLKKKMMKWLDMCRIRYI